MNLFKVNVLIVVLFYYFLTFIYFVSGMASVEALKSCLLIGCWLTLLVTSQVASVPQGVSLRPRQES